jgi:hypothetical protein
MAEPVRNERDDAPVGASAALRTGGRRPRRNPTASEARTRHLAPIVTLLEPYLKMLLPGNDFVRILLIHAKNRSSGLPNLVPRVNTLERNS